MNDTHHHTALLAELPNEVEARGLAAVLEDAGIQATLVPFADSAYPGIVDRGRPWGELRVAPEDLEQAQALMHEWRRADAEDLDAAFERHEADAPEPPPVPAPGTPAPWLAAVLSLLLPGLGQLYVREPMRALGIIVAAILVDRFFGHVGLAFVPVFAAVDAAYTAERKRRAADRTPELGPYRDPPDELSGSSE